MKTNEYVHARAHIHLNVKGQSLAHMTIMEWNGSVEVAPAPSPFVLHCFILSITGWGGSCIYNLLGLENTMPHIVFFPPLALTRVVRDD